MCKYTKHIVYDTTLGKNIFDATGRLTLIGNVVFTTTRRIIEIPMRIVRFSCKNFSLPCYANNYLFLWKGVKIFWLKYTTTNFALLLLEQKLCRVDSTLPCWPNSACWLNWTLLSQNRSKHRIEHWRSFVSFQGIFHWNTKWVLSSGKFSIRSTLDPQNIVWFELYSFQVSLSVYK